MKKILLLTLLTSMTASMWAEESGYLVFTLNDGTTKSITTKGLKLTFANGNLTATNSTDNLTIVLASLQKMFFSDEGTTEIAGTEKASDDDGEAVYYDLQGHQVQKNQMRKGVYIVKTKNKTYKMTVK